MDIEKFRQLPLMGIVRGIKSDAVEPLVETVVSSGLKAIEITMNTQGAPELIGKMARAANDRLMVGAGTVLTMQDLDAALNAGATFIVTPILVPDVTAHCRKNGIPIFPGALTPKEIYDAWCAGAAMVKVFPSQFFGPAYFKEILGPFQDVALLACGGVNSGNIRSYFKAGAKAASFGGSIFKTQWMETSQFSLIGQNIEALIKAFDLGLKG